MAFSVGVHLNAEIEIMDEVLGVGDGAFQQKCFDRMKEIINEGHAAILVSHGMPQIRQMSQLCMWLSHGQVRQFGPTDEVVSCYESEIMSHVGVQTGTAATGTTSLSPELSGRRLGNDGGC